MKKAYNYMVCLSKEQKNFNQNINFEELVCEKSLSINK